MDQEMATDLLNNSKRHASIAALEAKVAKMSPWDGEYDTQRQMLRTLKEEEASVQKKADGHEMDIFDVWIWDLSKWLKSLVYAWIVYIFYLRDLF